MLATPIDGVVNHWASATTSGVVVRLVPVRQHNNDLLNIAVNLILFSRLHFLMASLLTHLA